MVLLLLWGASCQMVSESLICSGVVRVLGKPKGHATLGGSQRPGFLSQMSSIGRPGVVDSVKPFPEVLQCVSRCVPSILQQVVILLQEGGLALGKLLPDPGEQVTALPPLLGSECRGVDVIAMFPHLPDHQPPLLDQFGGPGVASFLAVQIGVVDLLSLEELLGHLDQQEVFPSNSVLLLHRFSDCPRTLHLCQWIP